MGYSLGQNGQSWPGLKEPLANNNRGGFYIRDLRLKSVLPIDSTFLAVVQGNLLFADVQEAYLQKKWGGYVFTAGKFRGAGLKSGSGTDEFDQVTVRRPLYASYWSFAARLINNRDFGIQVERTFFDGSLSNKFYFHNANRENVLNDEPSNPDLPATQALGLDYAVDWKATPYTTLGGHLGALANQAYDEFLGSHKPWEIGYWFKSNPMANFSLYHQLDNGRFHALNEGLVISNREIQVEPDLDPLLTWGASSRLAFDYSPAMTPFARYEFFDLTNGLNPDDALHLFTLGAAFHPSPASYAGLKVTAEYVRTLEEGLENLVSNDILYVQLQLAY